LLSKRSLNPRALTVRECAIAFNTPVCSPGIPDNEALFGFVISDGEHDVAVTMIEIASWFTVADTGQCRCGAANIPASGPSNCLGEFEMAIVITIDEILHLAPNVRSSYREAFQRGQVLFDKSGISATGLRVAHFMAQVLHESGGLTIQFENLNYSPERLPKVWPSRFRPEGPLDPIEYGHNPQKLANEVYGKRMGNVGPNDGFNYRGRGLLQLTGKDSYADATRILRHDNPAAPDFVDMPDEVISANWCLQVAVSEWVAKGCNARADQDNIKAVTRAINGGANWTCRTNRVGKKNQSGLAVNKFIYEEVL
jgi:putative chitinase